MLADCYAKKVGDAVVCDVCGTKWSLDDVGGAQCKRAALIAAGGHKDDHDKVRMELIPPELLVAVGDILTFGAKKYDDRNWEHGMKWSRVHGALLRHLMAWWGGEDHDPETGRPHLWHAACCIAFLVAYEARDAGEDDRWKGPHA